MSIAEFAITTVGKCLSTALDVFSAMLESTGLLGLYLAMAGILLSITYLLGGFLLDASSGTASDRSYDHPKHGKNSNNRESKNGKDS